MSAKRILIVGGVAAGSSAATRARRLDEEAEIVVFERGAHVSFANCGLPYHVGDVIEDEEDLLLVSPQTFAERFDIDVRVRHEVLSIDRERRELLVANLGDGSRRKERYDALVLATGAGAFRPPVPGLDLPGVFTLRTVPESRELRQWLDAREAKRAVVVGAGFVGLETAENLRHRGLDVTVVEFQNQVIPALDAEMATPVAEHLREQGVELVLGDGLSAIEETREGAMRVRTGQGKALDADVVILALGVRPRTDLAKRAGITTGPRGGVVVDGAMRTNDPHIWAVGDVAEDRCVITGGVRLLSLAGPANRQGRMAADSIYGREMQFRGVQGTSVCGLFGMTVAMTGLGQGALASELDIEDRSITLHPKDHVSYYPGAEKIHLKLIYEAKTGRVLGAQAVGQAGVAKRIDVIAMAIQMGATVFDLEQAELCYAPQFGAAKDPVNMAGMIAANELRGDLPAAAWRELVGADALLVDVREADEFERGHVEGAINLPLSELRGRLDELPTDRDILLYCQSGKRSYDAVRALHQRGYRARTLVGGMESYLHQA